MTTPTQGGGPRRRRVNPTGAAISILLWGYVFIVLAPMLLILLNSMRPTRQIFREPIGLPESINFDSYVRAWGEANFSEYFLNSVIIVVASVTLATAVSALAAYILGRHSFRGSTMLAIFFLSGLLLPFRLAILPLFLLLQDLGLVDTRLGLILVYAATGVPFSVFILSAYFRQLPVDLAEAAKMDGAGEYTIFGRSDAAAGAAGAGHRGRVPVRAPVERLLLPAGAAALAGEVDAAGGHDALLR